MFIADCCDKLFDLLDNFAENNSKKRLNTWPLQMMLLVLNSVSITLSAYFSAIVYPYSYFYT